MVKSKKKKKNKINNDSNLGPNLLLLQKKKQLRENELVEKKDKILNSKTERLTEEEKLAAINQMQQNANQYQSSKDDNFQT